VLGADDLDQQVAREVEPGDQHGHQPDLVGIDDVARRRNLLAQVSPRRETRRGRGAGEVLGTPSGKSVWPAVLSGLVATLT